MKFLATPLTGTVIHKNVVDGGLCVLCRYSTDSHDCRRCRFRDHFSGSRYSLCTEVRSAPVSSSLT